MEGLTLVRTARAIGMTVHAEGGDLIIRGPKRFVRVANALLEHKGDVLKVLAESTELRWPPETVEVFTERLGIADDLGMDTSPGSRAWLTALREAKRAGAGIPSRFYLSREPDAIDVAIASFEFLGGVRFLSYEAPNSPRAGEEELND